MTSSPSTSLVVVAVSSTGAGSGFVALWNHWHGFVDGRSVGTPLALVFGGRHWKFWLRLLLLQLAFAR
ncbi:hypothetical protein HYQ46_005670 [Verticillium longisporum]|nr:hypothetical protein HYQ46_005670 [Verticillium longisporum]